MDLTHNGNNAGEYQTYLDFIKGLPSQPRPEIFGFHDNADITKDMTQTERLLTSMLLAAPSTRESTGGETAKKGPSPDETLMNIAMDIQSRLPINFDIEAAQGKYPVTYLESMNTVLCQVCFSFSFSLSPLSLRQQVSCIMSLARLLSRSNRLPIEMKKKN